jgi:hypothetical protein
MVRSSQHQTENVYVSEAGGVVRESQHGRTDGRNQLRELRQVVGRFEVYSDAGISGAQGRNGRPGLVLAVIAERPDLTLMETVAELRKSRRREGGDRESEGDTALPRRKGPGVLAEARRP